MTWFGTQARQTRKQRGCPELTSIDWLCLCWQRRTIMTAEQNEGARRTNDLMHQERIENQNQRVEQKLDEIAELLKELLERQREKA